MIFKRRNQDISFFLEKAARYHLRGRKIWNGKITNDISAKNRSKKRIWFKFSEGIFEISFLQIIKNFVLLSKCL